MFSTELGFTLEAAFKEASMRGHAYFCVEHLLFALTFDERIAELLKACAVDQDLLKRDLEHYFDSEIELVSNKMAESSEPIQTPAVQRVLQEAIRHGHAAGKEVISSLDVFVAIFNEIDSHAVFFLLKQELSKLDVIEFISHGVNKQSGQRYDTDTDWSTGQSDLEERELEEESEQAYPSQRNSRNKKALERYAEDLTLRAEKGELDPLVGRDKEVTRAIKILCRRQKNNPLFLGDPGVGKTAMAHGIAQRIISKDVPDQLIGARLFALDVGSLLAGTKFRGEFEERLKSVLKELTEIKSALLFIDEIHTIVGAGSTGSGTIDAANLLKPALASGKLKCLGSTTFEDFKKSFEKDRALSRRFSSIELLEPSIEETIEILKGLKSRLEQHHSVSYSIQALHSAAELSAKYINDRALPDKAIDILDEAGAHNAILPITKRKRAIGAKEIELVVATVARVPVESLSRSDQTVLKNLEGRLKAGIFGQDHAVDAVVRAIKRRRANIQQESRPIGCFLFAGPTGVGKTELAKQLAAELGVKFHRYDMSEYMEKHTVAKFIGAPPGYVGYEEGGQLTDTIRKHPYAVLLLDEIEKAHEEIFSILLQVMDSATLTDAQGKKADFRNVIIIMTTNAGSAQSSVVGFGRSDSSDSREREIKRLFKPEFRNRLDEIVNFNALPDRIMERIVDKFIAELEKQLKARDIRFKLSAEAKSWLAKNGFDAQLGARPMARLIQTKLKDPLTDALLFGDLKKVSKSHAKAVVDVELVNGEIKVSIIKSAKA